MSESCVTGAVVLTTCSCYNRHTQDKPSFLTPRVCFCFSQCVICSASQEPNNILFILSAPTNHRSTDRNLCEGLFTTRTVECFTESLVSLTVCVGYLLSFQWQHLWGVDCLWREQTLVICVTRRWIDWCNWWRTINCLPGCKQNLLIYVHITDFILFAHLFLFAHA